MITLVNTFDVYSDGDTAEFERSFRETATFLSSQPGFRGYHLVRSTIESNRYFNMGSWASEADLRAALAMPEMQEHHERLSKLAKTDPHPCGTVTALSADGTADEPVHDGPM